MSGSVEDDPMRLRPLGDKVKSLRDCDRVSHVILSANVDVDLGVVAVAHANETLAYGVDDADEVVDAGAEVQNIRTEGDE